MLAQQCNATMSPALYDRATGAYLGLAVGDALGATVEFMTAREIRHQYGLHDSICGGGWLKLPRGQVTDDTTMALALGDVILKTEKVDALAIAEAFNQWLKDKPVDIGNTVRRGIVHYRYSGTPVAPPSEQDAGNGACMRCLPVALFTYGQATSHMQTASKIQAHVTHNNELSDAACECVIAMIHAALDGRNKTDMLHGPVAALVQRFPAFGFRARRSMNPSAFIVETMQAVLQAFFDTDDFYGCLVDVVNRGGDADTTGAIAGMLAGSYYGLAAIPYKWKTALNKTIAVHCEQQATALINLALQESKPVQTSA